MHFQTYHEQIILVLMIRTRKSRERLWNAAVGWIRVACWCKVVDCWVTDLEVFVMLKREEEDEEGWISIRTRLTVRETDVPVDGWCWDSILILAWCGPVAGASCEE